MRRFDCNLIYRLASPLFCYLITANANMMDDEKINRPLILTATKNPLARDANLTVVNAGIVEKIVLDILSETLNFTYVMCPPSDILAAGTLLSNGSWTGATGQLQNREVDMYYVSTTAPTPARRLVADISNPIFFVETAIIIPFPPETNNDDVLYLAFQPKTWMGTGISFVIVVISTYCSQVKCAVYHSSGFSSSPTITPDRSLLSYRSLNFDPIVNSIEELANSKTVKALLVRGSSTDEYFMLTNDPTYQKIGDQMRQFPERRILEAFTVEDISTIVKDDYALILSKPSAESLIVKSFQINGNCRVTMAEKTFYGRGQSFSYPKNSSLTKIVDRK
uniref:Ionotropic glutamate receptor L-glutamate and glycine-binding domain-containing protein n=1 Tax=Daphnia galeata TaxID=27404 RepID=A0A8J2RN60_9CRUS|nr:unnamed protein product [Daphnia galeata]